MSNLTAARPFAESAFAVAKTTDQLSSWSVGLDALAIAYSDANMQRVLNNPSFDRDQQVNWLIDLAQQALAASGDSQSGSDPFGSMFSNFVREIALDRSFSLLPSIARLFQEYLAKEQNIKHCTINSASELSADAQQRLADALTNRFAQQVSCEFKVDPTLQAGVLIQSGDWVVDGTMLARINKLSERLLA